MLRNRIRGLVSTSNPYQAAVRFAQVRREEEIILLPTALDPPDERFETLTPRSSLRHPKVDQWRQGGYHQLERPLVLW